MSPEELSNDPGYRLGVITGRLQALGDLMELIVQKEASYRDDLVRCQAAIRLWMEQTEAECDAETALLLAELE